MGSNNGKKNKISSTPCVVNSSNMQKQQRQKIKNKKFDDKLTQILSFTVPVIGIEEFKKRKSDYVILDTREDEEYNVSHIKDAIHVGFKNFDMTRLRKIPKDAKIVLYCSVGYRSEKIGERLINLGYKNVRNLYGSIFEWVNSGNNVVDSGGKVTKRVHTYNRDWSQWVNSGKIEKIWYGFWRIDMW